MSWIIKDAVHGTISFSYPELCRELMDTPYMQRLRWIKQLGLAYLVFPSAEHTRFQHSIGTAYIASVIAKNMGCNSEEIKKCEAAGLLHDLGVYPFSHVLERGVYGRLYRLRHEDLSEELILNTEIKDILHKYSIDAEEIVDMITRRHPHPLSPIINGPLDADKLDYLQRDSYFTGVRTEIDPYVYHIFLRPNRTDEIFVIAKGKANVEAVYCSRYRLTQTVYFHHAVRVSQVMMNRAVQDATSRGRINVETLQELDDRTLLQELKKSEGFAEKFARKILKRELYKRVTSINVGSLDEEQMRRKYWHHQSIFVQDPSNILRLESFLAQRLNMEEGTILVDIPGLNDFLPPERATKVYLGRPNEPYNKNNVKSITDVSEYIRQIDLIYQRLAYIRVFSEKRMSADLRRKCERILRNLTIDEIRENTPWL